jgi:formiminoglutamase
MKSDMSFEFHPYTKAKIDELTNKRAGEIRVGEKVVAGTGNIESKYVILGIPESAGPKANLGRSGAENGFRSFLTRFLNMQSNQFFSGENTCIAGEIIQQSGILKKQFSIEELDSLLIDVLEDILLPHQKLIVIGGGHNNAYPIIAHFAKNKRINIVNLDPHADCRETGTRHSGNPFSYGIKFGHIEKYHVLGLHKAYNNQFILDFLKEHHCHFSFFDDYLLDRSLFLKHITELSDSIDLNFKLGIELDMDSIAFMPASAFTPSGITLDEARFYIKTFASKPQTIYLHLPEAAPTNDQEEIITGKALAYLVYDFITTNNQIEQP